MFLPKIVDQIVLVAIHPASNGEARVPYPAPGSWAPAPLIVVITTGGFYR